MDRSLVVEYSVFQDDVLVAVVPGDVNEVTIGPLEPVRRYDFQVQAEMNTVISARWTNGFNSVE